LSLEEIFQRTKISAAKLNVLLMSLMLKRAIKEYPGKIYKKVSYHNV
jgi:DNA processing protein